MEQTPQEYAIELVNEFYDESNISRTQAQKCAKIAIERILSLPSMHDGRMVAVIQQDYTFWKTALKEVDNL
jgi:hypothetical protein